MKNRLLAAVGTLGLLVGAAQGELKWLSDFEEGKKAAAESGKTMLVDFTGSDWCHWCIKLKEEVFSQEAFEVAGDKYVLVELDFPQAEGVIAPEQRAKNEELAQKLGVQGFPSVLLFDEKGRAFARTGYEAGGPEAYLKHLEKISKPFTDLKAAEGDARKGALVAFLRTLAGVEIEEHFSAELAELAKLDPEDETGMIAEMATAKAMATFEEKVEENLAAGDFDAVLKQVDTFLAEHDPQGEERQHILMGRVMVHVERGEQEEAFAEIDKMATFAPESEFTQNVEQIKKSISEHLELKAQMEKEAQEQPAEVELPGEPSVVEEAEAAEKPKAPTVNPEPVVE
ncbi:MAG: thioredoxin family protein [Roseibacillus sp.]